MASYLSEISPEYFSLSAHVGANTVEPNFTDIQFMKNAGVSVIDRALNYGDGCFTTMYCEHGKVFILDEHIQRLKFDTQKLDIPFCTATMKHCLSEVSRVVQLNERSAAAIKILVSRGVGGRGYEPPESPVTQIVISVYSTHKLDVSVQQCKSYKHTVRIANMQLSSQVLLGGIKHLNRLEQVFAKQELRARGCDDLLLCNQSGNVIEGSASNVFLLKQGVWLSPEISDCGVNGLMRKSILAFMNVHKIPCAVRKISVNDIIGAESVFLCNSLKFVVPVSNFHDREQDVTFNIMPSHVMLRNIYQWLSGDKLLTLELTA